MTRAPNRVALLVALALVLACLAALGLYALVHREQHAAIGEEIQWDDFAFSVVESRELPTIGESVAALRPSRGKFHLVRLRTRNAAKRVDYVLSKHDLVIEAVPGERWRSDPIATRRWRELRGENARVALHPGESADVDWIFDLPAEAHGLRVFVVWGEGIVDFVDRNVFGERCIVLGR